MNPYGILDAPGTPLNPPETNEKLAKTMKNWKTHKNMFFLNFGTLHAAMLNLLTYEAAQKT